jgi:hypothetical protein
MSCEQQYVANSFIDETELLLYTLNDYINDVSLIIYLFPRNTLDIYNIQPQLSGLNVN